MKLIAIAVLTLSLSLFVKSEINENKFIGQWDMVIKDTPNGDSKCIFIVKEVEGELKVILRYPKMDIAGFNIEVEGTEMNFMFSNQGNDLTVFLELIDDDNLEGWVHDMFLTIAVRKKELN